MLPDQKASAVKRFQDQGRFVAMAGDGINDAPRWRKPKSGSLWERVPMWRWKARR